MNIQTLQNAEHAIAGELKAAHCAGIGDNSKTAVEFVSKKDKRVAKCESAHAEHKHAKRAERNSIADIVQGLLRSGNKASRDEQTILDADRGRRRWR